MSTQMTSFAIFLAFCLFEGWVSTTRDSGAAKNFKSRKPPGVGLLFSSSLYGSFAQDATSVDSEGRFSEPFFVHMKKNGN